VRVPIWGIGGGGAHRGGHPTTKQVDGGESATAGRRRGGEHRLGVHGAAFNLSGGHCSDGRARRWSKVALDRKAASITEGGGWLSASTVSCRGWWLRGQLGVAQRRTRVVWGGRRLEQRSTVMWEQRQTTRAERSGRVFGGCHGKRRDGFSHGLTARRGDARGGGCMRHMWSGHGGRLTAPARGGGSGCAAIARARRQHPGAG
jgi:hypothetical protein